MYSILKSSLKSGIMKSVLSLTVASAALVSQASSHCKCKWTCQRKPLTDADIFEQFTHGGTVNPVYQYIRQNTNYNSPVIDLTSTDLRFVHLWGNHPSITDSNE